MAERTDKLAQIIRTYRQIHNLPLNYFAQELGVSPIYLEALESGETDLVSLQFLNRFLIYTGLPVQCFLDAIRYRPEIALWLAIQHTLAHLLPEDSLEPVYDQVKAIINKLGEIWLHCPSVDMIYRYNALVLNNVDDLYSFLVGWKQAASEIVQNPEFGHPLQ
ncbi:MAG: helix-turn-helix domain-containing protein [Chitinophagales bacterium]